MGTNETCPPLDKKPPLYGIEGPRHFIPIVRGGAAPFFKKTQWYVDWSVHAVREYARPGKNPARFQNAKFYFRQGIAVPMVASSHLTAALLEERLFDQGIVGVFPNDDTLMLYLLGFLNTDLATILLRQMNSTANNSANYIKRLPIVLPGADQIEHANQLVTSAIAEVREHGLLSEETANSIEVFYRNIWCENDESDITKAKF